MRLSWSYEERITRTKCRFGPPTFLGDRMAHHHLTLHWALASSRRNENGRFLHRNQVCVLILFSVVRDVFIRCPANVMARSWDFVFADRVQHIGFGYKFCANWGRQEQKQCDH